MYSRPIGRVLLHDMSLGNGVRVFLLLLQLILHGYFFVLAMITCPYYVRDYIYYCHYYS